jgi:hypothetical protein
VYTVARIALSYRGRICAEGRLRDGRVGAGEGLGEGARVIITTQSIGAESRISNTAAVSASSASPNDSFFRRCLTRPRVALPSPAGPFRPSTADGLSPTLRLICGRRKLKVSRQARTYSRPGLCCQSLALFAPQ